MKKLLSILSLLVIAAPVALQSNPLTNEDILRLLSSGLGEETVVMLIQNSESEFDTSAGALSELMQADVPESVIQAMIRGRKDPPAAESPAARPAESAVEKYNPEVILIHHDGETSEMNYLIPQSRTAARALGFGGVASYSVLNGAAARLRLSDRSPEFTLAIPRRAQPESYMNLASFAVRRNNSREVLIGGGYMSYSTGIHPDRIVEIDINRIEDQSMAPDEFVLYRISPKAPLEPGEYALVLNNQEIRVSGYFAHGGLSCFDFGIDP